VTVRIVVIGIDDTDMPGTRGTGRLARQVADACEAAGLGRCTGVTRHQFHVGPGVPYTSHNSSAAIGLESSADLSEVEALVAQQMAHDFVPGSDPGLAVLEAGPSPAIVAFARRAQAEVVTRQEAESLARSAGVSVRGLGGTNDGIIGALSGAALRWDGNDGRFVGLPGIRDLKGRLSVAEMLELAPISAVVTENTFSPLPPSAIVDTLDWVRPRLMGGLPVVVGRPGTERGVWINADRRASEE
jgi:hypothetical protein